MRSFDFLGAELLVGDFVAYPSTGSNTEYGLILYKVLKIKSDNKLQAMRLKVSYLGEDESAKLSISRSAIKGVKVVRVKPSFDVRRMMDHYQLRPTTELKWFSFNEVGRWLHGIQVSPFTKRTLNN